MKLGKNGHTIYYDTHDACIVEHYFIRSVSAGCAYYTMTMKTTAGTAGRPMKEE